MVSHRLAKCSSSTLKRLITAPWKGIGKAVSKKLQSIQPPNAFPILQKQPPQNILQNSKPDNQNDPTYKAKPATYLSATNPIPMLVALETLIKLSHNHDKLPSVIVKSIFGKDHRPIPSICNALLSALCNDGHFDKACKYLNELLQLGFMPDLVTYNILIMTLCKQDRTREAFEFMNEMFKSGIKPNCIPYNAIMSALCRQGMPEHAREAFADMVDRGVRPSALSIKIMVAGYCKKQMTDEAKALMEDMMAKGYRIAPDSVGIFLDGFTFSGLKNVCVRKDRDCFTGKPRLVTFRWRRKHVRLGREEICAAERNINYVLSESLHSDLEKRMKACFKRGRIEEAVQIKNELDQMNMPKSPWTYGCVVRGLCADRQLGTAVDVLEEMVSVGQFPDTYMHNLVLSSLVSEGMFQESVSLIEKMIRREVCVHSETFSTVLKFLCSSDITEAVRIWNLALRNGWETQIDVYRGLVKGLFSCGRIHYAFSVMDQVLAKSSLCKLSVCILFINELCEMGNSDLASLIMKEIFRRRLSLDSNTFNRIIRGCCVEGKAEEALELVKYFFIRDVNVYTSTFKILVPVYFKLGMSNGACRLKDQMLNKGCASKDVEFIYNVIIGQFCESGEADKAFVLFEEMKAKGVFVKGKLYGLLIQVHCAVNDSTKAMELFQELLQQGLSPNFLSYKKLVSSICEKGEPEKALQFGIDMLNNTHCSRIKIYNTMISCFCKAGSMVLAQKIFNEMEEIRCFPNVLTFRCLIIGYSDKGDASKAFDLFNIMLGKGIPLDGPACCTFMTCLCDKGHVEGALTLHNNMIERGQLLDSSSYNALIQLLCANGRVNEVGKLWEGLPNQRLIVDDDSMNALIEVYCANKDLNEATDVFNQLSVRGGSLRNASFNRLICEFCEHGFLERVLQLLEEIQVKDLSPTADTYNLVINSLCKEKKTKDATHYYLKMVENNLVPSEPTYRSLLDIYLEENNADEAAKILDEMKKNGYMADFRTYWDLISGLKPAEATKSSFVSGKSDQTTGNVFNTKAIQSRLLKHRLKKK